MLSLLCLPMFCYVYLIQCYDTDFYKIGVADDPQGRVAILQTGCPYQLDLVITCRMATRSAAVQAERGIHSKLSKYSVRGEWFQLPGDIVNQIIRDMANCSIIDH